MIARGLLRRATEVGPARLGLLAWTFLLLLTAKVALRTLPARKILERKQRQPARGAVPLQADTVARVRWAVLVVSRYSPVEFVCFPQCLVAAELLHRRGVATRLHYGAGRVDGHLVTHTWLEADGVDVIGGDVAKGFATLAVY